MNLNNQHNAFRYVLKYLREKGFKSGNIHPINKGRYIIVEGSENILIAYKKEYFMSFAKFFPNENGIGETINCEHLKEAIGRYDVKTIYTVHPDGKIYKCSMQDFLTYSHKRINNFENKEVRSINVRKLERVNKE